MSEAVTIRERIMRQLSANLATVSGIGTIYRWDMRTEKIPASGTLLEAADDEPANPDDECFGITVKRLPCAVSVPIAQTPTDTIGSDALFCRWWGKLEAKLVADRHLTEAVTGKLLTTDLQIVQLMKIPPLDERKTEWYVAVAFDVLYRHDEASPYSYGTLIPQISE